ncbi:MAG: HNH endonuclease signature motif containing protein, partial [Nocardioides sp.]
TDVIALVRETAAAVRAGETDLLVLAVAWADAHPDPEADAENAAALRRGATQIEEDHDPGAPDARVPAVAWDAGAPFAAALGVSTSAGEAMIRDALVLRHWLPSVWERLLAHELPVWRARRIAQAVAGKPDDVAAHLDEAMAPVAEKVGPVTLDRLIDEAMMRLYPEERELARLEALDARHATLHEESLTETGIGTMTIRAEWKDLHDFSATLSELAARLAEADEAADRVPESLDVRRSRAVGVLADPAAATALLERRPAPRPRRHTTLFVHLSIGAVRGTELVGRHETTGGPVLEQQVRDWCGRTDTQLTVVPVIDLNDHAGVDRYEVGERMRTRVSLLHPTCVFPWCGRPARRCDADHVLAHTAGGTTCDGNLAPLCRRHHRLKTKAGWRYEALEPGVWVWSEPHGQRFLRDDRGTTDITPARRRRALSA